MGHHRGERRAPRRGETADESSASSTYVGRRVAGRTTATGPVELPAEVPVLSETVSPVTLPVAPVARIAPVAPLVVTAAGRRRAARGERRSHPLVRALRPRPVIIGVATLAVAFGGAASSASQGGTDDAATTTSASSRTVQAPTALGGSSGVGAVSSGDRTTATVSRDSSRQALQAASGDRLVAAAERQAVQRDAALAQFAAQAEQQAEKLALNQWSLPTSGYRLTAEYGDVGLWATYHTGLDFAAPTGTPITSVANGTVTDVGYDGSYGNKTVVTLDDGTEVWYCHQTTMDVSVGDTVSSGQVIGTVGSTGNVTGPHLHLEVRPGGGDPVDPYSALSVHGLTP
ncbi:M23 family metallopeptidase [Nocardioides sp. AX2bis]|uniref:M23 family metallopeptidase n=1 Tax=Nocardioides sp. AX2bis TaxID=2653157 RepID=UPI0012F28AAF|nr:M23 family metallopeptidase [Nocardioides sp. AX2bis]VXB03286.1 Murein DD-endopeptidase MepM and murein hydrolase activator NlpD, contain LysM domain [Nocardioides sp. AX2bis]